MGNENDVFFAHVLNLLVRFHQANFFLLRFQFVVVKSQHPAGCLLGCVENQVVFVHQINHRVGAGVVQKFFHHIVESGAFVGIFAGNVILQQFFFCGGNVRPGQLVKNHGPVAFPVLHPGYPQITQNGFAVVRI